MLPKGKRPISNGHFEKEIDNIEEETSGGIQSESKEESKN